MTDIGIDDGDLLIIGQEFRIQDGTTSSLSTWTGELYTLNHKRFTLRPTDLSWVNACY